eukprot:1385674-Amphidinium_carterae.1
MCTETLDLPDPRNSLFLLGTECVSLAALSSSSYFAEEVHRHMALSSLEPFAALDALSSQHRPTKK